MSEQLKKNRKQLTLNVLIVCVLGGLGYCFLPPPLTPCGRALQEAHKRYREDLTYDCAKDTASVCVPAAEAGDVEAMIFMAEGHYQGEDFYLGKCGIKKPTYAEDMIEARRWYQKAEAALTKQADRGSWVAKRKLAYLYNYTFLHRDVPVDSLHDDDMGELNYVCPTQRTVDQGACFR